MAMIIIWFDNVVNEKWMNETKTNRLEGKKLSN